MLEIIEDTSSPLDHPLTAHLPALNEFSSTKEMLTSPLYSELRPEIERVLGGLVQEDCAHQATIDRPSQRAKSIRATAWNIERGTHLQSIIRVLREHPLMGASDLLLLTELDYGMARSGKSLWRARSPPR